MTVGILVIQAVAFAVLSGIVASNKNRDPARWSIIGFLFGLFGFIAAVAVGEGEETLSSSRQSNQPSRTREFNPDEHEKKCPMCAEYIKLEARRCKHCGHELSEEEVARSVQRTRDELESESVTSSSQISGTEARTEGGFLAFNTEERIVIALSVLFFLSVFAYVMFG